MNLEEWEDRRALQGGRVLRSSRWNEEQVLSLWGTGGSWTKAWGDRSGVLGSMCVVQNGWKWGEVGLWKPRMDYKCCQGCRHLETTLTFSRLPVWQRQDHVDTVIGLWGDCPVSDLEEQPLVLGTVLFLTTGVVFSLVDTELSNWLCFLFKSNTVFRPNFSPERKLICRQLWYTFFLVSFPVPFYDLTFVLYFFYCFHL